MRRLSTLKHEFVEFMPKEIKEGILYISLEYATASHKCCCGCGMRVVTPLHPTDWTLIDNGKSVSLDPSIGNWSFPCRSHYWIRNNKIIWAADWSQEQIEAGRAQDRRNKERYFGQGRQTHITGSSPKKPQRHSFWKRIFLKIFFWWLK